MIELFFARLISPDNPPLTFDAAVERFVEWKRTTGDKEAVDAAVVLTTLRSLHNAMCETPGMSAIVEEWTKNRAMGADCPPLRIPLLPRESATYCTTMTRATDEERKTMALYDVILATLVTAERLAPDELALACEVCYALQMAGFCAVIARAACSALQNILDNDDERRAAINMREKHEFETPEIAIMSQTSAMAAEHAADLNIAQQTPSVSQSGAAPAPPNKQ
jgi:hypothetical protein